jgi:hypothetical protein
MIEPFDILIHEVEFETGNGTKLQPVVLYNINQEFSVLEILGIYSYRKWFAYDNRFYEIVDWEQAGLKMRSFIKVSVIYEVEQVGLGNSEKVGRLSKHDRLGLQKFINNYSSS